MCNCSKTSNQVKSIYFTVFIEFPEEIWIESCNTLLCQIVEDDGRGVE